MPGHIPALFRETGIQVSTEQRQPGISLRKRVGLPGDRAWECRLPLRRLIRGHDGIAFAQASRDFARDFRCSDLLNLCELWLPGPCLYREHVLTHTCRYR